MESLKRKVSADEMLTIDFVQISLVEKGFLVQLHTADLILILQYHISIRRPTHTLKLSVLSWLSWYGRRREGKEA